MCRTTRPKSCFRCSKGVAHHRTYAATAAQRRAASCGGGRPTPTAIQKDRSSREHRPPASTWTWVGQGKSCAASSSHAAAQKSRKRDRVADHLSVCARHGPPEKARLLAKVEGDSGPHPEPRTNSGG